MRTSEIFRLLQLIDAELKKNDDDTQLKKIKEKLTKDYNKQWNSKKGRWN